MKTKKTKTSNQEKKICYRCRYAIAPEDRHVDLITNDKGKVIEKLSWHILCWGEYNQDRFNQRLKEMTQVGLQLIQT